VTEPDITQAGLEALVRDFLNRTLPATLLLTGPLADRKVVLRAHDERTPKSSEARLAYRPPDHADFHAGRLIAESLADGG
jgi:hypothetical protein